MLVLARLLDCMLNETNGRQRRQLRGDACDLIAVYSPDNFFLVV